jgi:hypothetical protein
MMFLMSNAKRQAVATATKRAEVRIAGVKGQTHFRDPSAA